jgi:hypothetical protein
MASTCGNVACCVASDNLVLPLPYEVLAPWVEVRFLGSGFEVTVGNESSPPSGGQKNHAVIKSFQYGVGAGSSGSDAVKIEILDEDGGEFTNFLTQIVPKNKDPEKQAADMRMEFLFGWAYARCAGVAGGLTTGVDVTAFGGGIGFDAIKSFPRYSKPLSINVSFDNGKIKYVILGAPPTDNLPVTGSEAKPRGEEGAELPLKIAISEMFEDSGLTALFLKRTDTNKVGAKVRARMSAAGISGSDINNFGLKPSGLDGGGVEEWGFPNDDGGFDGSKQVWKPNNRDPVQAAMQWLHEKVTIDDKAITVATDNSIPGKPIVVFWEADLPSCDGRFPRQDQIGTYIVNGGGCSPVLSFKPTINFSQGTSVNKNADAVKACDELTGKGSPNNLPAADTTQAQHPKDANEKKAKAEAENARAQSTTVGGNKAVEAELVVQGDPRFYSTIFLKGKMMSIIVINPFFIRGSGESCGDWTAKPPCNHFLSNRNWIIQGVDHQIKEGSFTTSFKVRLVVPGNVFDASVKQLGGVGSCGPLLEKV